MKLASLRTLILSAILGMVALPACRSTPSPSPTHVPATPAIARIAFYTVPRHYGSGESGIYLINADGSGLMPLAKNATNPVWSPDGQQIAFEGSGLHVMNADGTHKMTLISSNSGSYSSPTWSPDGKRIAFEYHNGDYGRIYTINTDGSGLKAITEGSDERGPIWSPAGRKIAFLVLYDHHDPFEIGVTNPDGSAWEILTEGGQVSWSPDSQQIAFVSDRGEYRGIYLMNADGSHQIHLADSALSPTWSPDGQHIAFISYRDGNGEIYNVEIYVMNADGSNQTRLTNDPADDISPAWSPDGKQIAFVSKRDGNQEIYVMNVDGSNQTRLTNTPEDEWGPMWQPR